MAVWYDLALHTPFPTLTLPWLLSKSVDAAAPLPACMSTVEMWIRSSGEASEKLGRN